MIENLELSLKAIFGIIVAITVIGTGAVYYYSVMNKPVWVLTIEVIGNGKVSLGSSGPYTTLIHIDDGQSILILAQADQGWEFSQWSGDLSGTLNPVNVVVTKDMRIIATFVK